MPNYLYIDKNGQRQGPVNEQQLRALAARGAIGPDTPLKADTGHQGVAGQILGLQFNTVASLPVGLNPFTAAPPVYHEAPGGLSEPTGDGKAIASLVCGIIGLLTFGGLLILPVVGLFLGIVGLKSQRSGIATVGICLNGVATVLSLISIAWAVAFFLPAIQGAQGAAQRMQCTNNIKQIVLALHNYHDTHVAMPPLHSVDNAGRPLHSWRVLILPFIEQNDLYEQIRLDEPWDSAHNRQFHNRMPTIYQCPSSSGSGCNYSGIAGEGFEPAREAWRGWYEGRRGIGFGQIRDGTSNTLAIVEVNEPFNWMDPNADITLNELVRGINSGGRVGSNHTGGINVGMFDGMVQFITDDTDTNTLRAMGTRAGGEWVALPGDF
ncbi:MAG: DUF1559 domain-containing protein [Planctomycetaceae bacterium]|nr:DUF1559 domain-containing protein [Planctomycetaceae bacterium]